MKNTSKKTETLPSPIYLILFEGLLKQWSFYAPDDSDLQVTLGFYVQFPFGGGDKRFDLMMKVFRALKTVLDLWNVGSRGGQSPSSEVHKEIRVERVKAYRGQSIKKFWTDSEGNENLQAGVVVFLRRYWWPFKRL